MRRHHRWPSGWSGAARWDRTFFDEVWEGDYHVAPAPHRRHGDVEDQLAALLRPVARERGLWPGGPASTGEPQDYRVPDRAYFRGRDPAAFEPTAAVVVEIRSPADQTDAKLCFYARRQVDELLVVGPETATVEWYARRGDTMQRVGRSLLLELSEADLAAAVDWPS